MANQNNPICEILPTLSKKIDAISIYREAGLSIILDAITREVEKFTPDVSTDSGRSEIASIAHKVARSKTFLDDLGKQLVAEDKAKIKKVDQDRKYMRDYLDDLKIKTRAPLTEYEEAEKARVDFLAGCLNGIVLFGEAASGWYDMTVDEIESTINHLESISLNDSWQEFEEEARIAVSNSLIQLRGAAQMRAAQDAKDAELERLRVESAAREEADRKAKVAADQKAAIEAAAEAAARAEREKIESEIAEKEAVIAAEKAAAEQKAIAEAAEKQAADDAAKLAEDQKKASESHRSKIESEALESIIETIYMVNGYPEPAAQGILDAIKNGKIKHVTLNY